jgi:hypothetical protein
MFEFEAEAEVQDGQIVIPTEYRSHFPNGTIVKITLPIQPKHNFFDQPFIQELIQNPPMVVGSWKMTRDEMHDR